LRAIGRAVGGRYQFYYANVLQLAVTLAVAINIVYAFWDIASHPLFRFLSGNTRTRWGRRRPWLLGGLPFRVVFLVLPYAVPQSFRQGGAYACPEQGRRAD
jgi:GPH family glycoside/pentoside/hexuronide:cation symporter